MTSNAAGPGPARPDRMPERGYLAALADELSILVGSITDEHLREHAERAARLLAESAPAAPDEEPDRIEFVSFDGATTLRTGQGNRCVLVMIAGPASSAGIVLTDDEAEALATSLARRVAYSRERADGEPT